MFSGHDSSNNDVGSDPAQDPNGFQFGGKGQDWGVIGHTPGFHHEGGLQDAGYDIPDSDEMGNVAGTGSAASEANRYQTLADSAMRRTGPTTDYTAGNAAANQARDSRAGQTAVLSMIQNRAAGGGPSAAALGMNTANDQVAQSQLAGIAGMRPGGNATQQAVGSGSGAYGNILANAGAARSAEISGAQGSQFGGFHAMQGGDITEQKMQDARTQHMANMIMGQRQLNQAAGLNFSNMNLDTQNAQMNANIYARMAAQRHRTAQGNMDMASAGNASKTASGAVGMITGGAGSGIAAMGT